MRPARPVYVAAQTESRTPLQGFTSTPRPLDGDPLFVWHGSIRSPEITEQAAHYGEGFFANHILAAEDFGGGGGGTSLSPHLELSDLALARPVRAAVPDLLHSR